MPEITPELVQLGKLARESIREPVAHDSFEAWDAERASLHENYNRYHDNPTHDAAKFVAVCGQLALLFGNNVGYGQQYTDSLYSKG